VLVLTRIDFLSSIEGNTRFEQGAVDCSSSGSVRDVYLRLLDLHKSAGANKCSFGWITNAVVD
jgi:hypothetical protein